VGQVSNLRADCQSAQPGVSPASTASMACLGCGSAALWGRLVTCGPIVNRANRAKPGSFLRNYLTASPARVASHAAAVHSAKESKKTTGLRPVGPIFNRPAGNQPAPQPVTFGCPSSALCSSVAPESLFRYFLSALSRRRKRAALL
jgi:hypothetical protein